jgi:cyclic pyranopterin phosphate synthase
VYVESKQLSSSVSLLQKGVFMISIFRSVLPRVTRSKGRRCFSTGIPYDTVAELNKVSLHIPFRHYLN